MTTTSQLLKVGLAQIEPVWLDRSKTLEKIIRYVRSAAEQNCELVIFGEAILPGYPFWLNLTNGAKFNDEKQKSIHARYIDQSVQIERGDLDKLCQASKELKISVYLGIIECPKDRGGHSLYCSMVYIDQQGVIQSVHRKLMPTYEERLSWAIGDGHGLVTHPLGEFTLGGLNCWENWMPLARASLYGQGENVHVAIWPGNVQNTIDLTPVIAKEGRSYVISVCGLMKSSTARESMSELRDIDLPDIDWLANGGSCVACPDGSWLLEPVAEEEELFTVELEHALIRRERQNFDPAGHYSRPDVLSLTVDRKRQSTINFKD